MCWSGDETTTVAVLGLILSFSPVSSSCPAVIIDVGGGHQDYVAAIFRDASPSAQLTEFSTHTSIDLANALTDATTCGAKVINMSMFVSGDYPDVLAAIQAAQAADVLLVAAAGNGGPTAFPAAYAGILSVGASDGPTSPATMYASGGYSSYASPKVAGAAYELRLATPALSAMSVTNILTKSARNGVLDANAAYAGAVGGYRVFVPAMMERR